MSNETSRALNQLAKEIERIHLATFGKGDRIVGLTAPYPASGVSLVASLLAERCKLSGTPTLLCDLSMADDARFDSSKWSPGDGSAGQAARADPLGFDRLTPRPGKEDKFRFSDAKKLRSMFDDDLVRYHAIIVDLAAQGAEAQSAIDATVAATACDAIMLVCQVGSVTRPMLAAATAALNEAGAPLRGVIANEVNAPTLGQEIAREARKLEKYAPYLARWIARKAEQSEILSIPA